MKVRHLNPRQMISIPEQRVTVRRPVLKAPPGKMRHTAEFMNLTPADQPPRQIALHLQPPVSLTQPGQATGVAVDQRHNLTLHLCPQPVLRRHPEIRLRLTGDIHAGKYLSPSGVLTTKPHDSLAHIAGRAPESLILSVSWDYCESLLMERKPPKLPTLLRNLQPLRHLLHLSFVISDVGWSYSSATAGP